MFAIYNFILDLYNNKNIYIIFKKILYIFNIYIYIYIYIYIKVHHKIKSLNK